MTVSYLRARTQDVSTIDRWFAGANTATVELSTNNLELEFVTAQDWNQLAPEFADIIPEQMGSFNTGHWGEDNLEFLIFRKNSKLVGGAVIIVRKIQLSGTGIAILKWGPICQKSGTEFDTDLHANIISCLKNEYCCRRNFHLTIMPPAKPFVDNVTQASLIKLGFEEGESLAAPERYIVNVQDDAETLMANLCQKWRYNLRKALKNDFDIKIADPKTGLDEFLKLYAKMMARKKFLDASAIEALERVIQDTPDNSRPIIVLVSHEDRVTAGGVFHVTGDMASYMFGATDDRALKLKAGYALHWWVAEYLCRNEQFKWYDLGGNDLDKGLHQFKKGFVGKSGHILMAPPRYHYANSLSAKLAGFAAFRIRDGLSSIKRKLHMLRNAK